jgi:GNAT superfamily N-acetyltransferase
MFPRLWPFISKYYDRPPHRLNRWSLVTLAVLPEYQNAGVGRELVAWGLTRAKQEGITADVHAAADKDRFYQRCGFTEVVGWSHDGVDEKGNVNPFKGRFRGGCIMYTRVKADDKLAVED